MKQKINKQVLHLINNRRSIRSFLDKKVSDELIVKIVQAGQRAPSPGNFQLYSVIKITNGKIRKEICNLIEPQEFVKKAPTWLIICVDWARLEKLVASKNIKPKTNTMARLLVGTIDASLFTQNMVIACDALGLGSILIGSPWCNMEGLAKLLHLPKKVLPIMLMCIGYPTNIPPLKPRWHLESIMCKNKYSFPSTKKIKIYYDKNNKKLLKMGYFEHNIANWKKHWQMRLTSPGNKRTWSKIPKAIRNLKF